MRTPRQKQQLQMPNFVDDDLPSALTNYGLPDLVEADSSDDESDDDDDDSDDDSNDIPGVPVSTAPNVT